MTSLFCYFFIVDFTIKYRVYSCCSCLAWWLICWFCSVLLHHARSSVHSCNFNKQHLILAKFYINNARSIGNQSAKFQLNLFMQTIVTAAFVRSPQIVKRPVLDSRLFNPDNVHGFSGNSATNFLAPYPFFASTV